MKLPPADRGLIQIMEGHASAYKRGGATRGKHSFGDMLSDGNAVRITFGEWLKLCKVLGIISRDTLSTADVSNFFKMSEAIKGSNNQKMITAKTYIKCLHKVIYNSVATFQLLYNGITVFSHPDWILNALNPIKNQQKLTSIF